MGPTKSRHPQVQASKADLRPRPWIHFGRRRVVVLPSLPLHLRRPQRLQHPHRYPPPQSRSSHPRCLPQRLLPSRSSRRGRSSTHLGPRPHLPGHLRPYHLEESSSCRGGRTSHSGSGFYSTVHRSGGPRCLRWDASSLGVVPSSSTARHPQTRRGRGRTHRRNHPRSRSSKPSKPTLQPASLP
ncbi:hypothetical protein BDY24DRAFT_402507 [Mrakia frigida]|uniref:uncharacterized protein n=1 Tax=Mrakia frigida TaxID=29902 RepID=UPI003FCC0256